MNYEDRMTLDNHFHSVALGCDMEYMPICSVVISCSGKPIRRVIRQVYCKTHKKFCSYSGDDCGWEWGWYAGTKTEVDRKRTSSRIFAKYAGNNNLVGNTKSRKAGIYRYGRKPIAARHYNGII